MPLASYRDFPASLIDYAGSFEIESERTTEPSLAHRVTDFTLSRRRTLEPSALAPMTLPPSAVGHRAIIPALMSLLLIPFERFFFHAVHP
jgi:hypothetical protein